MIDVAYFTRKPGRSFSVERVFHDVSVNLPADIQSRFNPCRYNSQGLLKRLYDLIRAPLYQGQVNHITGDVHYLAYLMRRKKTILTIHDCYVMHHSQGFKCWLFWFFWLWLPERRCRFVVAISHATKKELLNVLDVDPDKIRIIHDPVSDQFQPVPKSFDANCPRVLHIGTSHNKNLVRHVAALQGLSCQLIVVGRLSDPQRHFLETSGVPYTVFANLSDEAMLEQYRLCDLVLFASTYEGFGLPILEAQAVGRPVITSKLDPMLEVAGNAACFVDPLDVGSIHSGITRVISDAVYRNELVEWGFENIKRFNVKKIAEQYASLYREIAASS